MSGEMIENAISCEKIEAGESTRRSAPKKRENEVSNVSIGYAKPITVNQPRTVATGHKASSRQEPNTKQNMEKPQFTPIPITREYGEKNQLECCGSENLVEKGLEGNGGKRVNHANSEMQGTIVSSTMREITRLEDAMNSEPCPGRGKYEHHKSQTCKKEILEIEHGGEKLGPLVNEPVMENEAKEFLKFLKHSEYIAVEQLHK
ncbi:hypothetical protein PVK06_030435 [Gossypium arboreum]|uniref:Uncharacterized protein n=1 Tax=Gossypium arboreum TaxID=29729 RepID=A0ABR0NNA8_GOSAR|nr:hypothetical protein PVK06_030435 [Gossypium arboreum]